MKTEFDVTVAMPVFNAEQYIAEAVQSLTRQKGANIELLLLDDCSEDRSVEIALDIAHRNGLHVTVFRARQNSGVGVMRQCAIELAHGEYLFFLDSDDRLSDDCLEIMVREAHCHQADLVIGSHCDVKDQVETVKLEHHQVFTAPDSFAQYAFTLHSGYAGGVWNKLISVELLRQEHITFPPFRVGEDVPFIFQLLTKVTRVVTISKVTYYYVIHPGSLCQYNPREIIPQAEIDTHVKSKKLLKDIAISQQGKPYYMALVCLVMDYTLDTVRVLIEKRHVLAKPVSPATVSRLTVYPASFLQVVRYGGMRNVVNYLACHMPYSVLKWTIILKKKLRSV